jgi:hypothetical protein
VSYQAQGAEAAAGGAALVFIILLIAAGAIAYFLPMIIALIRKSPDVPMVILINLLLGWSVVGWIVALVMACGNRQPIVQVTNVTPAGPGWQPPFGMPPSGGQPPVGHLPPVAAPPDQQAYWNPGPAAPPPIGQPAVELPPGPGAQGHPFG